MKKRLAGILLSCILAVSLTACGGGSDNSAAAADSTTASATTEVGGKVVRVAAVDPQVALDPQQFTYSIVMKITDNITESLLTTTADGLVPTLLTGMPSISDDNMTYSFELLPDVKFHDGSTVCKGSERNFNACCGKCFVNLFFGKKRAERIAGRREKSHRRIRCNCLIP